MTEPGCLMAKILKTKYFRDSSFFDAELEAEPSLTWRSIIAGREALEQGMLRRIGDGMSTRIFEDSWFPKLNRFRVFCNEDIDLGSVMVNNLMNEEGNGWDADMVNKLFSPVEAKAIFQIHIGRHQPPDS